MVKKEMPTGVKIISVLYHIFAVFALLFGIMSLIGGGILKGMIKQLDFLSALGSVIFIVVGIFLLVIAIINFIIGRGLWQGKKWARILAIIFAVIGFLSGLMTLSSVGFMESLWDLLINGAIGGYLIFSKEVKEAFS